MRFKRAEQEHVEWNSSQTRAASGVDSPRVAGRQAGRQATLYGVSSVIEHKRCKERKVWSARVLDKLRLIWTLKALNSGACLNVSCVR